MDLGKNNIPPENFPYELDEEGTIVDSDSPAGIRLRYERMHKRVREEEIIDNKQEEREEMKKAERERVEAEGKVYVDPLVYLLYMTLINRMNYLVSQVTYHLSLILILLLL